MVSSRQDKLTQLLRPAVEGLGYELVGIEHLPMGKQTLLRIYIDSSDGITVEDCSRVSHQVSGVLDVEEPIKGQFTLEVSSPGIDRPLFNFEQFEQFVGSKVKLKLYHAIEGKRKITGIIESIDGDDINIKEADTENHFQLQMDDIDKANIISDL
ncbi:MAG: ribosome maturation factor RimP [Gammaproteobacteria bacterium]|nr:ribosome maturation factor RimP [Gammaproteobacteria bacterium]MCW8987915.1 ribosome maturation factor RimP [Gammaproteobacteria bacterium]MCW9032557.1 ribosome maturation factor RimP [Gammaproteobacteria bacterium]